MQYKIVEEGNEVRIVLSGALNFSASADFKALVAGLASQRWRHLTFDLLNVTQVDSVGLGLLYIAKEEMSGGNDKIRLTSPQDALMKMLELTEADSDFDIRR